MDMEGQEQPPKLLDQVRHVLRLHHYSIHTERSYLDGIKRYVHFHHLRCREDLVDGERKIEAFLTDLAVRGQVAASTQNQAMNALAVSVTSAILLRYSPGIRRCNSGPTGDQALPYRQSSGLFIPQDEGAQSHINATSKPP